MTDADYDYEDLGLVAGLEIHQQLDTASKLFCNCPTDLREPEESVRSFTRYLHPTKSELGEIDDAALEESMVDREFEYLGYDTTCLVEEDDEPPHRVDSDAIDVVMEIAQLLDMTLVDVVHVMRKIVVDGSNTSGFQRSMLVANEGQIETSEGPVGVEDMMLEEESAQRIEETEAGVRYSLDRLGIPLVEIGTKPDIRSPEQAREAAEQIGMLLRSTGQVKRGLGTIRQDVNVSIAEGARIELKGVQSLDDIDDLVRNEVRRQVELLDIVDDLAERDAAVGDIRNVTHVFEGTDSAVIGGALSSAGEGSDGSRASSDSQSDGGEGSDGSRASSDSQSDGGEGSDGSRASSDSQSDGGEVQALRLEGFDGVVGREIQPDRRLGTEFSDHAKRHGAGGIFHTDELPAYGVTEAEVADLRDAVDAGPADAVAIVADDPTTAELAIEAVAERAETALEGVPEETRDANDDATSRYLRPLPGAARMYPETDVPPVRPDPTAVDPPELLTEKSKRYQTELDLGEGLAEQVAYGQCWRLFEDMVDRGVDANLAAGTLESTLTELRRDGVAVEHLGDDHLRDTILLVHEGEVPREGITDLLGALAENPDLTAEEAVEQEGLGGVDESEVREAITDVVERNADQVEEEGMGAFSGLMGEAMGALRGKADGDTVSDVLREEIQKRA